MIQYQILVIWNFLYIKDLKRILRYWNFRIKGVFFIGCNIGNRIKKSLFSLYRYIRKLVIASDPIGNKGQKKLARLNLPCLFWLELDNTNCTTDCLKNIRKMTSNLMTLKITRNYRLNCSALLFSACLLFVYPYPKLFMEALEYDKQHYVFINILSKRFFPFVD